MKKSLVSMLLFAVISIFAITAYAVTPSNNVAGTTYTNNNSNALGFMTAVDVLNDSLSGIILHNTGGTDTTLTGIFIQSVSSDESCTNNTLFTASNNGYGILWTNVAVAAGSATTSIGANYLYNILNLAFTYASFPNNLGTEPTTPGSNNVIGQQRCIQLGITNASTVVDGDITSLINDGGVTRQAFFIPINCTDPTSSASGYCIATPAATAPESDTQTFTP